MVGATGCIRHRENKDMIRTGITAGLGCLVACSGQASADIQVDVGCFSNINPVPSCSYEGAYEPFITSWEVDGYTSSTGYTMIDIDISGIMALAGESHLVGVTIMDFGSNSYGALSPGADIDYVQFLGLDAGIEVHAEYAGSTQEHSAEDSEALWNRIGSLDAFYGANHIDDEVYVSLGQTGALELAFSGSGGGGTGGGDEGGGGDGSGIDPWGSLAFSSGLHLQLAEVGSYEQFAVYLHTSSIPAPAGVAVMAGILRRRRRR